MLRMQQCIIEEQCTVKETKQDFSQGTVKVMCVPQIYLVLI